MNAFSGTKISSAIVAGQLKILFLPFTRLSKLMSQFFHQHVTLFNPQGETLVARCSMENPGRETKVSVLKKYKRGKVPHQYGQKSATFSGLTNQISILVCEVVPNTLFVLSRLSCFSNFSQRKN